MNDNNEFIFCFCTENIADCESAGLLGDSITYMWLNFRCFGEPYCFHLQGEVIIELKEPSVPLHRIRSGNLSDVKTADWITESRVCRGSGSYSKYKVTVRTCCHSFVVFFRLYTNFSVARATSIPLGSSKAALVVGLAYDNPEYSRQFWLSVLVT